MSLRTRIMFLRMKQDWIIQQTLGSENPQGEGVRKPQTHSSSRAYAGAAHATSGRVVRPLKEHQTLMPRTRTLGSLNHSPQDSRAAIDRNLLVRRGTRESGVDTIRISRVVNALSVVSLRWMAVSLFPARCKINSRNIYCLFFIQL